MKLENIIKVLHLRKTSVVLQIIKKGRRVLIQKKSVMENLPKEQPKSTVSFKILGSI